MSPVRYNVTASGGGGSGGGGVGPIIKDYAGTVDASGFVWSQPDAFGAGDGAIALVPTLTDNAGLRDSLTLVGTPTFSEVAGAFDTLLLGASELAQLRSGTPDADTWGDAWVDRLLANQGVNHGADAFLTVSAITALTETDGYVKVNLTRLQGLVAGPGASTFTFVAIWPTVAATPNATLNVDLRSSATSPWTESTVNGGNKTPPRITSSAPYSTRAFTFGQDGATRTHVVTFTAAEVNDFAGKWLELQFTVPDLTAGTISVQSREAAVPANRESYNLSLAK